MSLFAYNFRNKTQPMNELIAKRKLILKSTLNLFEVKLRIYYLG